MNDLCAFPATQALRLVPAVASRFPDLLALLVSCGLPGDDLGPHSLCGFVQALAGESLVGNAGVVRLPAAPTIGLLRSVAVAPDWRGCGLGARLLADREAWAAARGIRELYLIALDPPAAAFFAHYGYQPVTRDTVPAPLAEHAEFTFLCGSQCECLMKALANDG